MPWSRDAVDRLYEAIGGQIRDARQQANLTQTDLANRLGMTRSSVANIEAGRQRVTVHMLVQIAEEVGASVMGLLVNPAREVEQVATDPLADEIAGQPDSTSGFIAAALRRATD